jgi:galactokinase
MDQFSSSLGESGKAIFLDTRSLAHESLPLPAGCRVAIVPSGVRRELGRSAYNDRRREVESAARRLGLRSLRDLPPADLEPSLRRLPSPERERARHVVTENSRVLDAVEALRRGDPEGLGDLMNRSHRSLRDDFEASCPELDVLTEICRTTPGCHGSRLTGAGWGGATVSLVADPSVPTFVQRVTRRYRDKVGLETQPLLV